MAENPPVSRARSELAAAWFGTLVVLGLSAPLLWALNDNAALRSSPWALAMLVFPLLGVFLVFSALRLTMSQLRFGRLEPDLDPSPGSIGGHAGGSIRIPIRHRVPDDYRVTLSCIHSHVRRSSDGTKRSESVVWTDERVPAVEREGRAVRLRFTFDVPGHLPPTQEPSEDHHYWSLRVEGRVPGVDLDRVFDVPVMDTAEPLHAAIPVPAETPQSIGTRASIGPIRIDRQGDAVALAYPMGREWGMGVAITLFGLVFFAFPLGIAATIYREGLAMGGFGVVLGVFVVPIISVFVLVGGLLLLLGLYTLLNGLDVMVSPSEIRSTRRVLFLSRGRTVALDQIERVEMKISGRIGSGARARVSYTIVARLRSGRRLVVGDGIRGPRAARAIAALITDVTGLEVLEMGGRQGSAAGR